VTVIGILIRPRTTFSGLAASPRVALGFAAVLVSGIVALALGIVANQVSGGGSAGALVSLLLPPLFLVYWVAAALIIDAGAGLSSRAGRWRPYLAVSGFTLVPWIAYALLTLVEALVGPGTTTGSIVEWLTLPLLAWFLYLTTLAVHAVFDVTPFVALALAMLPDAVLLFVLIAVLTATSL